MDVINAAEWAKRIKMNNRMAAAKLISAIERQEQIARDVLKQLFMPVGNAHVIGVTGSAGAGKSCVVSSMISAYRKQGRTVGVIAIDPSSPFTGGAFLGDRLRMQTHGRDKGVYIRSMATRGYLGGLARGAVDAMRVMEAMGHDVVIVETVGTGQDEVDVSRLVQTCLLVVTPTMGDDIQAMKAGIMEIAQVIVLNKSDMPGKDAALLDLEVSLRMRPVAEEGWLVPVVPTVATTDDGIEELMEQIEKHQAWLRKAEGLKQYAFKKAEQESSVIIKDEIERVIFDQLRGTGLRRKYLEKIVAGEIDPYTAVEEVMTLFIKKSVKDV
ncbi:MAG: methylmalonyl Co-A mutase-associated GTPase MeaB [Deltaproteobacteria bacterium]|nr:methylmalonyl Co-A mutase-associated GTPase MeaB [Deltaproteobacteria bacterium]